MKYENISIWDFKDYRKDLNIGLSKTGREIIKNALKRKYGLLKNAAKKNNIEYTGLLHVLRGRWSINFKLLTSFVEKLDLNKNVIENETKEIVLRRIRIKNVKFPICCDPVFASLAINLLGDGGTHKNNGLTGVFHYAEEEPHKIIQEKIDHTLGLTPYRDGKSVPSALVFLFKKYFKIKSFYTKESTIPNKILTSDKLTKVACIIAFINDEGTVTTANAVVNSSNYKLLNRIRKICTDLGYDVSKISCRKDKEVYNFRINKIKKLYKDYKELVKKYPMCRLINRKERPLRILDTIKNRPQRGAKEVEKLIISSLRDGAKTIYDLCEITQMTQSGVLKYIKKLIKNNLIKRIKSKSKTRFLYKFCDNYAAQA